MILRIVSKLRLNFETKDEVRDEQTLLSVRAFIRNKCLPKLAYTVLSHEVQSSRRTAVLA